MELNHVSKHTDDVSHLQLSLEFLLSVIVVLFFLGHRVTCLLARFLSFPLTNSLHQAWSRRSYSCSSCSSSNDSIDDDDTRSSSSGTLKNGKSASEDDIPDGCLSARSSRTCVSSKLLSNTHSTW